MAVGRPGALAVALAVVAASALAAQTPRDSAAGRLYAPDAAGRPRERVTARDNDSLVMAIEKQMRCTCGCNLDVFTCRTTDFTCTTSPAMHRLVLARLDSGMTEAQVIAAFQAQYGEAVMMAPPKRGFNWAAYLMPFVALGIGLGVVGLVMRHWIRARPRAEAGEAAAEEAMAAATGPPGSPGEVSSDELERLKRELQRFEA